MEEYTHYIKTKLKSKRILTALLLTLSFFSLFGPFAKLSISSSLSVPFTNNSIKSDTYKVGTLNLSSFATFSNIGDIKVGNRPINQYDVFGINIYSTLKSPPVFSNKLNQAVDTLDPVMLSWMSNEDFNKQLLDLSPQFGQQIFDVSKVAGESLTTVRGVMQSAQPIVLEVDKALEQTADAIRVAEMYKTIANIFIFSIFALTFISIVLFSFSKIPLLVPRLLIAFTIVTVLIMVIAIPVAATQIDTTVTQITTQLNTNINTQITAIINNIFGANARFITFLIGNNTNYIHVNVSLDLGVAPFITLATMIAAFVMSFFIVKESQVTVIPTPVVESVPVETQKETNEEVSEEKDPVVKEKKNKTKKAKVKTEKVKEETTE